MLANYPEWVCRECAFLAGGKIPDGHISSWHAEECPCCGEIKAVTQPRDFGYPPLKVRDGTIDLLGKACNRTDSNLGGNGRPEDKTKQFAKRDLSAIRRLTKRSRKIAGAARTYAIKAARWVWNQQY